MQFSDVLLVLCALAASVCYALFSWFYTGLVGQEARAQDKQFDKNTTRYGPTIAATLLYALAATMLVGLGLLAWLVFGWQGSWPTSVLIGGTSLHNDQLVQAAFLGLITAMTLGYSVHLITEAHARGKIDIGAYAIIFQFNVVVIALLPGLIPRQSQDADTQYPLTAGSGPLLRWHPPDVWPTSLGG